MMDYSINSRPLLQHNSDSEDFGDEEYNQSLAKSHNDNVDDPNNELYLSTQCAPNDKYKFNYIIFYLMGMTTLLPWNFFITAEEYWMFKFRNVTSESTTVLTPIQAGFTSDLSVASAVPNTLFLILNAFIGHRIPLNYRMVGSLIIIFVFFICTTALIEVNTDTWQELFFRFTLTSVVVMNMASAILSGGILGISALFHTDYITAVVSGQALGGIFAAFAEIISLSLGASPKTSAFFYFMIGNVVLLLSIILYIVMSKSVYFKYFTIEKLKQAKSSQHSDLSALVERQEEPNFYVVLQKIWIYGFAEWLVFVITLSIYPSVTVLVESENHGNGHPWNDIYFIPVVNYLLFNSGDYLGRIIAGLTEWPHNNPYVVALLSILRIVFVPALLFCNTNPRHTLPILIHSDYIYILIMAAFSFSNGYLANIALIWAPKSVHSREKEMASSIMAAFMGIGLAFGSSISLIVVQFI